MDPVLEKRDLRWLFVLAIVLSAGLMGLAKFRPPTGTIGPDALRMTGRLHVAVLHLPIGLLLTLPVLEILGWIPRFRGLKQSTSWILGIGTLGAVITAGLGYLLATNDGYHPSQVLTNHMWGGVITAGLAMMAFTAKIQNGKQWQWAYGLFLILICGVLPLAAHAGGSLSHGVNYLSQFSKSKKIPTTLTAGQSLFVSEIQPIFNAHCIGCHGAEKSKANMRLDSFEMVKKADPDVLDPVHSDMVRRISLRADDEEAMPPGGKNRLSQKEIEAIKTWIKAGAGM